MCLKAPPLYIKDCMNQKNPKNMPWKIHTIVLTVMALKGIEYEYRAVNLIKDGGEQKKEDYVKNRNPMGEVPTFVDGDTMITQVKCNGIAYKLFYGKLITHLTHSRLQSWNTWRRSSPRCHCYLRTWPRKPR